MLDTMTTEGGIGLAAPQVGWNVQAFVMNVEQTRASEIVLINPQITFASPEMIEMDEGCLSVPGVTVRVRRPALVNIRALVYWGAGLRRNPELQPKLMELALKGMQARCAQHEHDHLLGILFTQRGSIVRG